MLAQSQQQQHRCHVSCKSAVACTSAGHRLREPYVYVVSSPFLLCGYLTSTLSPLSLAPLLVPCAGKGDFTYASSGNTGACCKGPHAAAYNTFWNLASGTPGKYLQPIKDQQFGPLINFEVRGDDCLELRAELDTQR